MAMLRKLFSSKVRIELLSAFFLHPEKSVYIRELERITGEDYKNISTELRNLESIGLLTSSKSGNLKYFHVNPGFLIYSELKSIFFKVRGAPALLKQVFSDDRDIEYAFIYGSLAGGTENDRSDIDLMVVGEMSLEDLLKRLREPEKLLGRDINPSLFQIQEIKQRMKDQDPFIGRLIAEPKIMLMGNEDDLRRLAQ
jgi:predicted nucleotidyltransferase